MPSFREWFVVKSLEIVARTAAKFGEPLSKNTVAELDAALMVHKQLHLVLEYAKSNKIGFDQACSRLRLSFDPRALSGAAQSLYYFVRARADECAGQ